MQQNLNTGDRPPGSAARPTPTEIATQMAQPPPPVNPLLERARIPGQTFALPSRCIFYNDGEVDEAARMSGEVMIMPMVTIDELIMKTPDRLLNGTAIAEVFSRCIPQVLKPNGMLAKDIDFLMICLRRVTYGEDYTIVYTHDCEDAKEHTYVVPLDELLASGKALDVEHAETNYTLTLPNGQVVKVSPPKYYEMMRLYQTVEDDARTPVEYAQGVCDATTSIIVSVDGINDKKLIREWVTTIPAGYTKQIGNHVGKLGEWGPTLTRSITCRDCSASVEASISLNPMNFFS